MATISNYYGGGAKQDTFSASTYTFSAGTGYVSGDLYLVWCVVIGGDASLPTSITNSKIPSFDLIDTVLFTSTRRLFIYRGFATASGTATTAVNFGSTQTSLMGSIDRITGVTDDGANGANLIDQVQTSLQQPGSSISFSFSNDNSNVYYTIQGRLENSSPTPASVFTPTPSGFTALTAPNSTTVPWAAADIAWDTPSSFPVGGTWDSSYDMGAIAFQILDTAPEPDDDPLASPSGTFISPTKFKIINWFSVDLLTNRKLNKQSQNQLYLVDRKLSGNMKHRDEDRNNAQPNPLNESLKIYGEYRNVSTTPSDRNTGKFRKDLKLPSDLYVNGRMPVVFVRAGYYQDAIKQVSPIVYNPKNVNYTVKTFTLGDKLYEGDMDYFFNILSLGNTDDTQYNESFYPVYWGTEDEQLQISSLALNQMAENSDYIYHNAIDGIVRNMDFLTKTADPFIKYLNNETALYAQYEEFSPGDNLFDKNDAADSDTPKQFNLRFEFPEQFFDPQIQPVVIYNLGAKVISEPGTEIRKITGILKGVRASGFSIVIKEWSDTQDFSTQDVYFCSYVAIGQLLIDSDEHD